jgi:hypothetical protein
MNPTTSALDLIQAAASAPVPTKKVSIKSPLGSTIDVEVRAMTGAVKKAYRTAAKEHKGDMEYAEARLVVASAFDPATNAPLFTEAHLPLIQQAPYLFEGVIAAANDVNGWNADEGKVG